MELEEALYRPLLTYIRAKKMGQEAPAYSPRWGAAPLHKLCRLALLLQEAHFEEEAGKLAASLLRLQSFPSLWCPEKEFQEKRVQHWFSKIGSIAPKEGPLDLPVSLTETAVFTWEGQGTSLGVMRLGGIEIPAFGPQSDPFHFGIEGQGKEGWVAVAADPEIWLEMKPTFQDGIELSFRFVGVKTEAPLFLAFYVRAKSCQVGRETLAPKSLRKFSGETQRVQWEDKCFIESGAPHRVEITPLAGAGCFWDADFLLTYPISPFAPQISLRFLAK